MVYEKNMILLKRRYFEIYKKVKNISIDEKCYEVIDTKSGFPTLKINSNDRSFYLHSKYNPLREAESFANENFDKSITNYIIYGTGLFYHIKELLEKSIDTKIYVFESNIYILKAALKNIDLGELIKNPRFHIVFEENIEKFSLEFSKVLKLDNKKLIIHSPSLMTMPESLVEIRYLLEEFKMNEISLNLEIDSLEINFKENIKNYDFNVDVLFNKFTNLPLIIVSAGPSLDKNKEVLKHAKGKALILCVGTAVKSLVNIGIEPDLIIITDARDFNFERQLKGMDIDVPIIVLSTCDKNVLENYKGVKFIAFQQEYESAENYAKENHTFLIETGGSVATTALDISIRFGCEPIIFVGQDLAYSDNKSHAEDIKTIDIEYRNLRPVTDINGATILTSIPYYSFLRWIENRIRRESDRRFIDATEGGARIKGTEIMTLRQVVDEILEKKKSLYSLALEEVKKYASK